MYFKAKIDFSLENQAQMVSPIILLTNLNRGKNDEQIKINSPHYWHVGHIGHWEYLCGRYQSATSR